MADNYVQIRIKATDTAKPDLTSLKADLDELGSKVDTAKIDVNDDDAKRKLLEVNAELARLNKRVASSRIDVAGAAKAESDLARVSDKFDELREKADKSREHATEDLDKIREHASKLGELTSRLGMGSGLLGRLMFGSEGGEGAAADAEKAAAKIKDSVGGIVGLLRQLPGGGGAEGGGSALGIFGNLSGSAAGGAGGAFGIGALLVELDGLVSGFAAAGAGAGAFALLAIPAFDKVKTAFTAVNTAQAAYQKAQLTEKMDPTAANATAVSKALLALKESYKGLDPAERGAVSGLQRLDAAYHKMAKAFEPDAFKVFNDGLKIANQLMPALKPFADTFATSLDGLLKQVSKFAGSSGFKDWLKQFHQLEGPSVTAIGRGIGQLVISIGKLFTIMSKKDVVNSINIAFKVLAGTIDGLGFVIRRIMLRWDQWQKAFDQTRHALAEVGHDFAVWFDRIRSVVAQVMEAVASRVSQDVDRVRASFDRWRGDLATVVGWFRELPGRILGALASLPGKLFSFGAHIISMLASGIASAIGSVTSAIGSIAGDILDHIPHSPAKKGPLSGRGDPRLGGMRIAQLLAEGMTDGLSGVSHAADRMAGAAGVGAGGAAGGGGGRAVQLEVNVPRTALILGNDFWTAFANGIRAKGGSPGIVTMKVRFS